MEFLELSQNWFKVFTLKIRIKKEASLIIVSEIEHWIKGKKFLKVLAIKTYQKKILGTFQFFLIF